MEFADVLLTREDVDAKADALIDFIRETVVGHQFTDDVLRSHLRGASPSAELTSGSRDVLRAMEQQQPGELAHAPHGDHPEDSESAVQYRAAVCGTSDERGAGE